MIASRSFRNAAVKKDGVGLAVDLTTRTKQLGAKEKARRKTCDLRVPFARRTRVFQKHCMRNWREEAVGDGFGACESVGRTRRPPRAHRKAVIEEADGSERRQARVCFVISFHGGKEFGG